MNVRDRVRIGDIAIDPVTMTEALTEIDRLVLRGAGGAVFTPNVDHLVAATRHPAFRASYARADLVVCDGQPILWASRLLNLGIPEKVSGSDLFLPLMRLAARRRFRVFLLGGGPGVAEEGARRLERELGVMIAGWDGSRIGLAASPVDEEVADRIARARPHLVAAFLGAPKSELFTDRIREQIRPAVVVNLGASIDFYLGRTRRAPRWMQRAGLEWLFRLLQEPRRLARRYLIDDLQFLWILLRTTRERSQMMRGGARTREPDAQRMTPAEPPPRMANRHPGAK